MNLSQEERDAIVAYRLERAKETLAELPILEEKHLWHNAANRLYYAVYYAASALLINDGHEAHTHGGVRALLGMHYVKTGKIDDALNDNYRKIFNLRQTGDYDDLITLTKADVVPLFAPAEKLIQIIEKLILTK